jgi:hypothetical protein
MDEDEYREVCVRNWCLENSMKINKGKSSEDIIKDAKTIHNYVRYANRSDCEIYKLESK